MCFSFYFHLVSSFLHTLIINRQFHNSIKEAMCSYQRNCLNQHIIHIRYCFADILIEEPLVENVVGDDDNDDKDEL